MNDAVSTMRKEVFSDKINWFWRLAHFGHAQAKIEWMKGAEWVGKGVLPDGELLQSLSSLALDAGMISICDFQSSAGESVAVENVNAL